MRILSAVLAFSVNFAVISVSQAAIVSGSGSFAIVRDCSQFNDGEFCSATNPDGTSTQIDVQVFPDTFSGSGSSALASAAGLGSASAVLDFGGPASLPVLRGQATSVGEGRPLSGGAIQQGYVYAGPTTSLALDGIVDYVSNSIGEVPGTIGSVSYFGQASVRVGVAIYTEPSNNFAFEPCGGSTVLASAVNLTRVGGSQSFTLDLSTGCDGNPLILTNGMEFYVYATLSITGYKGGAIDLLNTFRIDFSDALSVDERALLLSGLTAASETSNIQTVDIDIKPQSNPNCFNSNGRGVIPVAILGSDTLDVLEINTDTLNFGGLDVRVRAKRGPMCSVEYANADVDLDLICKFEDDTSAWEPDNDSEATLTGQLNNGDEFSGSDSICVVP